MKRFLPLLILTGLLFGQDTTLAIQEQAVEDVETDFNDESHTFEVVLNLLFEIGMWSEVWLKYDDLWIMGFISPSFFDIHKDEFPHHREVESLLKGKEYHDIYEAKYMKEVRERHLKSNRKILFGILLLGISYEVLIK